MIPSTAPARNRWTWPAGTLLVVLAVLERAWLARIYAPVEYGDTGSYFRSAAVLARGSLSGYDGTRVPGYPIFVALLGLDPHRVWLGQMALGVGISLLLYLWTVRTTRSASLGLVVAGLYNLIPGQFLFEANLLTETLTAFLVILSLYLVSLLQGGSRTRVSNLIGVLAGLAAGAAGLVRILFYPLLGWLLPFVWAGSPNTPGDRLRRTALLLVPALLLLGGWVAYIQSTFGFLAPSTMGGYNLVQHTGVFFELLPDEHAAIRDTYLRYREIRLAERGDQTNTIWEAIPELTEVTGLGFYDLSRELQRLSIELVLAHPDLYARNVIQGWVDFWKAPVYWEPGHVSSDGMRTFLATWATLGRAISLLANALFLLMIAVASVKRRFLTMIKRDRGWVCAAGLVLAASVLQTLLDHGDNPRFLVPLQMVVIFCVVAAAGTWRQERRGLGPTPA